MYLRILKKDLKRKKTMNIIILLFVILASMFVSSSVNNIITVMNGLDYYFDKADMNNDYFVISMDRGESALNDVLDNEKSVTGYRTEPQIFTSANSFTSKGKELESSNAVMLFSIDNAKLNYFDEDNNIITSVKEGETYVAGSFMKEAGLKVGDKIDFELEGTKLTLTIAGGGKDCFLGSEFMGNKRFIINQKDYDKILENKAIKEKYLMDAYYIDCSDTPALKEALSDINGIVFDADKSLIRTCYVMNMIVAGVLLVVSVGLILVAFTVLRFTIGFTIAEEFREIGVMKAVGIGNFSIRKLYIIKYLGIALIGAVIGFAGSIPFGNMLLKSVTENMVIKCDNGVIVGVLCSLAVVVVIMLFCYSCTRKVNKLSPIDAVRNGQTGERFGRKSIMSLGKSKLSTTNFLAVNDVLSSPKQFSIITLVLTICLLIIMILANTANTLKSDKLLPVCGFTKSDVYYDDTAHAVKLTNSELDDEAIYERLNEIENTLSENGMEADCTVEVWYKYPISFNGTKFTLTFQQGKGTHAEDYYYTEGTAPQNENEIAITKNVSKMLGAGIGDEVTITIDGEDKKFMVTAFYSSMSQLGEIARFHENVKIPNLLNCNGVMSVQIDFKDDPDSEEIDKRIEKIKKIFGTTKNEVQNANDYTKHMTGNVADTIEPLKYMSLVLTLIITALVTVLMERSFISKEKSEIALMKAIGISGGKISARHTLRFVIVSLVSAGIAAAVCLPLTKLCVDPIFAIMGSSCSIDYEVKPIELFVIYPIMITAVTVLSAFLTSLYNKSIKASDTSNIE